MLSTSQINEEVLNQRLEALPASLREALGSNRNLGIVDDVCRKNLIIDEDKCEMVRQIVGLTILGFIHTYDVGGEIDEALGLNNPQFSKEVGEELNAKVFAPIKTDLESNYHPISPGAQPNTLNLSSALPVVRSASPTPPISKAGGPKMLEEIRPIVPITPSPDKMPVPKPALPETGWSKLPPSRLAGVRIAGEFEKRTVGGASGLESLMPKPPIIGSLQKTEMGKIPTSAQMDLERAGSVSGLATSGALASMPVFMKTDAATVPLAKAPDLATKSTDKFKVLGEPPKPPARPAVIEFGPPIPPMPPRTTGTSAVKPPASPPWPSSPPESNPPRPSSTS